MTPIRKPKKKKKEEEDYFGEKVEPLFVDGWPTKVPVLTEEDIAWNYCTRDGARDLVYWLEDTFGHGYFNDNCKQFKAAYTELCAVITERFGKKVTALNTFLEFTVTHRLPSKAWQAACWNEMLSRLGYVVLKAKTEDPGFKAAPYVANSKRRS